MTAGDPAEPGAGRVCVSGLVPAPPDVAFAVVAAWSRQGEWIPATRVRVVEGDGGTGSLVEAVTGMRGRGLRDLIRVGAMDRPREIRIVHVGRVLRGPGAFRFEPVSDRQSRVTWCEWFHLPAGMAGRAVWVVLRPAFAAGLRWALRRLARQLGRPETVRWARDGR